MIVYKLNIIKENIYYILMSKLILVSKKNTILNENKLVLSDNFKFFPIKYTEPSVNDLAIILVYYNFSKSNRMIQNLLMVKDSLDRSNIPYFLGEIAFGNEPFYFNKKENIFTYRTDSYMFYKENLINIIEEKIPEKYTKLCIIDSDIMFDDPIWYDKISEKLNSVDIIQPYLNAVYLNFEFKKNNIVMSKAYFKDKNIISGHLGFAWAFKRVFFKTVKMCDFCICGGGDYIFSNMIMYNSEDNFNMDYKSYLFNSYKKYIKKYNSEWKVSYLDITIYHLFHSSLENRQYGNRDIMIINLLNSINLTNIEDVIEYNSEGVLKWKDDYKELFNENMFKYFNYRKDDSL